MMSSPTDAVVDAFIDLRSPYSYLALKPARALAERTGIRFDWWPYITDFRDADRLGVFGAPTFVYRGELFWGGDRLEMLEATISSGTAPDAAPIQPPSMT
jgi:2-hydroxychromene-2-carboxylate isomerase